jgi:hypothetical protein
MGKSCIARLPSSLALPGDDYKDCPSVAQAYSRLYRKRAISY